MINFDGSLEIESYHLLHHLYSSRESDLTIPTKQLPLTVLQFYIPDSSYNRYGHVFHDCICMYCHCLEMIKAQVLIGQHILLFDIVKKLKTSYQKIPYPTTTPPPPNVKMMSLRTTLIYEYSLNPTFSRFGRDRYRLKTQGSFNISNSAGIKPG